MKQLPVRLTVLTRSYCHLCDEMIAALEEFRGRFFGDFVIEMVDVDLHPAIEAQWGDRVPVLMDGEAEICHYFLDQDRLASHLANQPERG